MRSLLKPLRDAAPNFILESAYSVIRSPLIDHEVCNWSPGWAVSADRPVNTGNMAFLTAETR